MYDALNVLSAMDIIRKDKYNIIYNHYNEHIPSDYGLEWSESSEDNATKVEASIAKTNPALDAQYSCTMDPEVQQRAQEQMRSAQK